MSPTQIEIARYDSDTTICPLSCLQEYKCKEDPRSYAVAKRKLEKIRLAGIRTLTSAILVQRSNQLSYQANWELVIKLVRNIPGKDEDEIRYEIRIFELRNEESLISG